MNMLYIHIVQVYDTCRLCVCCFLCVSFVCNVRFNLNILEPPSTAPDVGVIGGLSHQEADGGDNIHLLSGWNTTLTHWLILIHHWSKNDPSDLHPPPDGLFGWFTCVGMAQYRFSNGSSRIGDQWENALGFVCYGPHLLDIHPGGILLHPWFKTRS